MKKIYFYKSIFIFKKIYKIKKNIKENIKKNIKKYFFLRKKIESKEFMVIKKNTIKFCVFLGREKNMILLHSYVELLLKEKIIHEYHMFDFSRNINDHIYIQKEYNRLNNLFLSKIYLHHYEENEILLQKQNLKNNWKAFYQYISKWNNNDIIIKCDDDILFIDVYSLKNAIIDRINDKISFLIHSNCINNGVCAYFQSKLYPMLENELSIYPEYGIMGPLFEKPELAYAMHKQFCNDILTNNFNKYIIDDVYITTRISINFILLRGSDAKYLEKVDIDDEYELSSLIPEKLMRPNKIKGDLITSHLSYTLQNKVILNKHDLYIQYQKIVELYLKQNGFSIIYNENNKIYVPKCHIDEKGYKVKNWMKNKNFYYIKNIENNKYLYIDYEDDQIRLSDTKTIFEIIEKENDIIKIKLGIYYITRYSCIGKFTNENIYFRYFRDEKEKELKKEYNENKSSFCLKFIKYNHYLGIKNELLEVCGSYKESSKWIFEKVYDDDNHKNYLYFQRIIKNNKFYYQNIEDSYIYTNYCMGWGINNLLW